MIVAGLIALAVAPVQAPPAPPAPPSEPDTVEELVVEGATVEDIRDFVAGVSASTKNDRLPRWDRSICPAVIGLKGEHGRYVNERIADTAQSLGLVVEGSPCRPEMVVLVTPEPDKAAERLMDEYTRTMAVKPRRGQMTSAGTFRQADAFVNSDRPVRWWHAVMTAPADGRPIQAGTAAAPGKLDGFNVVAGSTASHRADPVRDVFTFVVVVVDGRRLQGVTYEQLASYLSMVALAKIEPEPQVEGLASILTLFDDVEAGRSAPESLTAWDTAYLKGLYAARSDLRHSAQQSAIVARMGKAPAKGE